MCNSHLNFRIEGALYSADISQTVRYQNKASGEVQDWKCGGGPWVCVDKKQQRLKNSVTWGWCLLQRMSVQWFYPVTDAMSKQNNPSTLRPLDCNSGQDVASVYTHPTMSHPPSMIIVRNSLWVNLISQNISCALETTTVAADASSHWNESKGLPLQIWQWKSRFAAPFRNPECPRLIAATP